MAECCLISSLFLHVCGSRRGFMRVFRRRTVGVHRGAKRFELDIFIRRTFLWLVKLGVQNHPNRWSICPVPSPE